jgi:hypothetical protein
MTLQNNQVGWYCGLQGPFADKLQALAIRQPAVKVGYKPQEVQPISYRVDPSLWKAPNKLLEKQTLQMQKFL